MNNLIIRKKNNGNYSLCLAQDLIIFEQILNTPMIIWVLLHENLILDLHRNIDKVTETTEKVYAAHKK